VSHIQGGASLQDLLGRLNLLDPTASEGLKVISYFDTLLESGVSVDSLVRGAALLVRAAVGFQSANESRLFAADGRPLAPTQFSEQATAEFVSADCRTWIQRSGPPHANDNLVLERLAVAIGVSSSRTESETLTQQSIELLLAPRSPRASEDVLAAASRLHLVPGVLYRAVAAPLSGPRMTTRPSAVLATPWGVVRATIVDTDMKVTGRVGIGSAELLRALTESWGSALFALRANRALFPLHADDLGVVYELARHLDDRDDVPADVRGVETATDRGWLEGELLAVAEGASLRSIASVRGLHHSTVSAKLPGLTGMLGFDPSSPFGRTRLHIALVLWRVAHSRFN
jgi:hypothetical protein